MHRYITESPMGIRQLHERSRGSASDFAGLRITAIGPDFMIGDMPVDERTRQPFGLLHGGMSMVLAETLGSLASTLLVDGEPGAQPAGIEISGSHLRAVRDGRVTGTCHALKLGRNLHFWRIDIRDAEGRLCCSANLTVHIARKATHAHA